MLLWYDPKILKYKRRARITDFLDVQLRGVFEVFVANETFAAQLKVFRI